MFVLFYCFGDKHLINEKKKKTIVAEFQLTLSNERVLKTGEPCTCEYVTLLQSFHRGILSIQGYITQNV